MGDLITFLVVTLAVWHIGFFVFDLVGTALTWVFGSLHPALNLVGTALKWAFGAFVLWATISTGVSLYKRSTLIFGVLAGGCFFFFNSSQSLQNGVFIALVCLMLCLWILRLFEINAEIADMLKDSFDRLKIIPVSDINNFRPNSDAPQELAERWVSEGKLQKKELWDKKEYYYLDEELIQNMYREIMSMAKNYVNPLLNDKGVYFDAVHIRQLAEYINSGAEGSSTPHLKRVTKDILQGIVSNVHSALPGFDYVMLKEDGGTLWLFTCDACEELFQTIQAYGPKSYCADCLAKIHAQEKADEAAGKTVKRYINAPPGAIIRDGK